MPLSLLLGSSALRFLTAERQKTIIKKWSVTVSDFRILGPNGTRLNYTCENRRFRTNIDKGYSHGSLSPVKGSVLEDALINTGYSLWLEHVLDKTSGDEVYWLMWYDHNGTPTIPMSGIFGKDELEQMIGKLARFVP